MNADDSFFRELDKKKEKKQITVRQIIIFLILVVALLEVLVFFIAHSIRSANFDFKEQATKINPFSMSSQGIDINTVSGIVLSEKTFCEQIYKIYNSKDISCVIRKDGVYVYGRFSTFTLTNANMQIVPKVENGRTVLTLADLRFGRFESPQFVKESVQKKILTKLENVLNPAGFTAQSIDLSDNLMIVSGSVNQ